MGTKDYAASLREWQGALDDPHEWDQQIVLDEIGGAANTLEAMGSWLDQVTSGAFFGATAPDASIMQFTITLTASEWRAMRALVEASGFKRSEKA